MIEVRLDRAVASHAKSSLAYSAALHKLFVVPQRAFPLTVVAAPTPSPSQSPSPVARIRVALVFESDGSLVEPCALHVAPDRPRHALTPGTAHARAVAHTPDGALLVPFVAPETVVAVALRCFGSCATVRRRPTVIRITPEDARGTPLAPSATIPVRGTALPARERAQAERAHGGGGGGGTGHTTRSTRSSSSPAAAPAPPAAADDAAAGSYTLHVADRATYDFLLHVVRGLDALRAGLGAAPPPLALALALAPQTSDAAALLQLQQQHQAQAAATATATATGHSRTSSTATEQSLFGNSLSRPGSFIDGNTATPGAAAAAAAAATAAAAAAAAAPWTLSTGLTAPGLSFLLGASESGTGGTPLFGSSFIGGSSSSQGDNEAAAAADERPAVKRARSGATRK